MKKKFIILFIIYSLLILNSSSAQWDDCPFNEVNCTAGCGRFIDTDESGYCDHSEPEPEPTPAPAPQTIQLSENQTEYESLNELITGQELKTKTVEQVAYIYNIDKNLFAQKISEYLNINVKTTDSFQVLHDNYGSEPSKIKEIASALAENKELQINISKEKPKTKPYIFWSLVLPFVIIYLISFILAKKKIISMINHKKVWNLLLFTSFFLTGISGILLVIKLNYGVNIPFNFSMLFWHVETGIAFVLIAFFHIFWHSDYFKAIFKGKNK